MTTSKGSGRNDGCSHSSLGIDACLWCVLQTAAKDRAALAALRGSHKSLEEARATQAARLQALEVEVAPLRHQAAVARASNHGAAAVSPRPNGGMKVQEVVQGVVQNLNQNGAPDRGTDTRGADADADTPGAAAVQDGPERRTTAPDPGARRLD